jgi:hypothetical protein
MTAPSYTTDLTELSDCTSSTGWYEATASGWTDINAETYGDTDDYIHGTSALSSSVKTGVGAVLYNTSGTIPTDGAFLVWIKYSAAGGLYTESSGGIFTVLGDATNSFYAWYHLGSDSYLYDGWLNLATNNTVTQSNNTGTYAGSSTVTYWGWGFGASSIPSKGNPFWCDILRYGRCELRVQYGETADYCTFPGMATANDATTAKWGLMQAMPYGYLWKGKLTIGYNSVAADFRDENRFILVDNTKHVTSAFNAISIESSGTNVEWTNIQFKKVGTVSPGTVSVGTGTTVTWDKCAFTDMGTFTFNSGATVDVTDTTFRRCGQVQTGGGDFDGCVFEETSDSVSAVEVASPADAALITNSSFISSGTKHGLEITGTAANITITGLSFTGYDTSDPGTAANKAIYVNISSGSMTINISGGSGVSEDYHVRTAGCTVTISADTTVTFTGLKDNSEVRIYKVSDDSVVDGTEDATTGTTDNRSFQWSAPSGTEVYYRIHCFQPGDEIYETIFVPSYTVPSTDTSVAISQRRDRNCEN